MSFDLGLKGKRALVTGGTKGIGAAVVEALRGAGARVVTTARSVPAGSKDDVHYIADVHERAKDVRAYVLARAKGICEGCGHPASFKRRDGSPYLEPHHLHRVSDGGPERTLPILDAAHRR